MNARSTSYQVIKSSTHLLLLVLSPQLVLVSKLMLIGKHLGIDSLVVEHLCIDLQLSKDTDRHSFVKACARVTGLRRKDGVRVILPSTSGKLEAGTVN